MLFDPIYSKKNNERILLSSVESRIRYQKLWIHISTDLNLSEVRSFAKVELMQVFLPKLQQFSSEVVYAQSSWLVAALASPRIGITTPYVCLWGCAADVCHRWRPGAATMTALCPKLQTASTMANTSSQNSPSALRTWGDEIWRANKWKDTQPTQLWTNFGILYRCESQA